MMTTPKDKPAAPDSGNTPTRVPPRITVTSKGIISPSTPLETTPPPQPAPNRPAAPRIRLPKPSETRVAPRKISPEEQQKQDDTLRKQIINQLADLGEQMRMTVQVSVRQGEVFLNGTVDTHFNRLLITSTVSRLSGPKNVHDELKIRSRFNQPVVSSRLAEIPFHKTRNGQVTFVTMALALIAATWFLTVRSGLFNTPLYEFPLEVVYKGKPAAGAQLTLYPQTSREDAKPTFGAVQADGKVVWSTVKPGDGIPKGNYTLTAVWYPLIRTSDSLYRGSNLLPAELENQTTSPFRLSVSSGKQEPRKIDLKQ